MPDFTPEFDFPYPTGAESPNGPGGLKALADAVEAQQVALANPSFTNVTYNGAWTDYGSLYEEVSYAKVGTLVLLRGLAKHGTAGTTGTVFTLPDGYRPARQRLYKLNAGPGWATVTIDTAGIVSIVSYVSSGTAASLSFDGITFDTAA